jgi:dipeptidase E
MMRLLLLSNARNFGQGYLQHAEGALQDFLGKSVRRVLFVPFAAVRVTWDAFAATVRQRFDELGYALESVHAAHDPVAAVMLAQAIVVGGGNTWSLLDALYRTKLLEAIRERALAGAPYVGWSAGANIAGLTIKTTNDMPIVLPPRADALALVPFQLNPHYTDEAIPNHAGETRTERLLEFVAANPGVPVVGLREGSILRVEGSALTLLGEKPARLFTSGAAPAEYAPGPSLQFLMR